MKIESNSSSNARQTQQKPDDLCAVEVTQWPDVTITLRVMLEPDCAG